MKKERNFGFTLIELIITLVIVALLFGTSYMYMTGYLPKQRLSSSVTSLVTFLKMAQSRAMSHSLKYGVYFISNANSYYACGFADKNSDFLCTGCDNCTDCSSCASTEMAGEPSVILREGISILDNHCSSNAVSPTDPNWKTITFDIKGMSYNPLPAVTLQNFEIFLKGYGLSPDSDVREIEVNSGGSIEAIKLGQTGNIPGAANQGSCN